MYNEIIINYTIGDKVCSYDNPYKIIGTCTGFVHNNTCIEIDGKCWGGKYYFLKADFEDIDFEIITDIPLDENDIKELYNYTEQHQITLTRKIN